MVQVYLHCYGGCWCSFFFKIMKNRRISKRAEKPRYQSVISEKSFTRSINEPTRRGRSLQRVIYEETTYLTWNSVKKMIHNTELLKYRESLVISPLLLINRSLAVQMNPKNAEGLCHQSVTLRPDPRKQSSLGLYVTNYCPIIGSNLWCYNRWFAQKQLLSHWLPFRKYSSVVGYKIRHLICG